MGLLKTEWIADISNISWESLVRGNTDDYITHSFILASTARERNVSVEILSTNKLLYLFNEMIMLRSCSSYTESLVVARARRGW